MDKYVYSLFNERAVRHCLGEAEAALASQARAGGVLALL